MKEGTLSFNKRLIGHGAEFITDSGSPFVFYRSLDCTWRGGSFTRSGVEADVITDEAAAVTFTRSLNCRGKRIVVDGYYRNLQAYRAPLCGFDDWCQSVNALYFNYYTASVLDITCLNRALPLLSSVI